MARRSAPQMRSVLASSVEQGGIRRRSNCPRALALGLIATLTTLAGLLLIPPAGSALTAGQYEPGAKVAPGVFLAEVPQGGPSAESQARSEDLQPRIVGGNPTTIAEWPWQAAVTVNPAIVPGNGFDRQICGGSLVAPTIIVTAAHCVYSGGFLSPGLFASITGRTTLSNSSQGQEIAWSTYYVFTDSAGNPLFKPNTSGISGWDVIFARLGSPSPSSNSSPIQIAGANEAVFWAPGNENAWATGWGRISSGGASSDTLREVNIDRIADATCGAATSHGSLFDPETMVCAGEIAGGQSACQGDSGGPLVTPVGGGAFRLIGDTSFGPNDCGAPNLPGVWGRVAEDPMCSALQEGIQTVAGVNVVGAGGCLGPRTLTVNLGGSGTGSVTGPGISCPGDCTQTYAHGTSVTLNAAGTGGSTFAGWGGACSGTGSCQLTMDADKAVSAGFLAPVAAPPAKSGAIVSFVTTGKLKVAKRIQPLAVCSVNCNVSGTGVLKGMGSRASFSDAGAFAAGQRFGLFVVVKRRLLKLMKANPGKFRLSETLTARDPTTGATSSVVRTFKFKR